jgi:hypothetical protein
MRTVAWNDLEMQVPTFLVRHFTPHKSAENFLNGGFCSRNRAQIIHKSISKQNTPALTVSESVKPCITNKFPWYVVPWLRDPIPVLQL